VAFEKGRSGNPSGRPRRPRLPAADELRNAIVKDLPVIVTKLVAMAKDGDTTAARLLLDRALPSLRPTDAPVTLRTEVDLSDLLSAPTAVLAALGAGDLTPEQAATIAASLAALVRVREFTDLEARIEALESKR